MYKKNLALNNLHWSICHKTKTKPSHKKQPTNQPNSITTNVII